MDNEERQQSTCVVTTGETKHRQILQQVIECALVSTRVCIHADISDFVAKLSTATFCVDMGQTSCTAALLYNCLFTGWQLPMHGFVR
jgi:hypothetical protein